MRLLSLMFAMLVLAGCGSHTPAARTPSPSDSSADPGLSSGVVLTHAGAIRGLVTPAYLLFQGIPYAAPPVGALRWQPPQPAPAWSGVRDATMPGTRCVQDTARDPDFGRTVGEDCLSVSVWAPRAAPSQAGRPVMVWFHGGGFANGSADIYGAQGLVTRGDIIVVTVNYRLGAPGFLAHPGIGGAGNYGLVDQQAALRWVRDSIASFGGDPTKVTIAGQSAGGMSVCDHLVAPGSAGLFRSAIIASGPCSAQAGVVSAQRDSIAYAAARGCPDGAGVAACLRALPATRLSEPPWFYRIGSNTLTGPAVGTPVLPVDPVTTMAAGDAARVPVLIGTTHDEFTLFMALEYLRRGRVPTAAEYPGMLAEVFGPHAGAVGAHYRIERFGGDVALAYSAAVTDAYFSCVADRIGDGQATVAPVYAYEFNDPRPPTPEPFHRVPFPVGASHALDLRYVFAVGGAPRKDLLQQRLSDQMIDYWTSFVNTGIPGFAGGPVWPAINGHLDDGPRMSFEPNGARVITTFERDHQCAFWA
ncbi:MAG TPA: carboxylesterase family protein, partial [Mycobacterium sp.]|nr:carboxylesterase family protein [Mycobacterium sp.]